MSRLDLRVFVALVIALLVGLTVVSVVTRFALTWTKAPAAPTGLYVR